tara:strand:+ start:189 stop:350 length:162 start_codon:yes stop_codon:yes gene_type:complete
MENWTPITVSVMNGAAGVGLDAICFKVPWLCLELIVRILCISETGQNSYTEYF